MVSDEVRRRKKVLGTWMGCVWWSVFPVLISSNFKQFQMTNYSWSERKLMVKRKNQEKEQRWMDQVYQGLWALATRNGKNQSEVLKAGSSSSWVHTIAVHLVDANWWYCWWKKSCTSCCGESSIIYRVLYISGGAGFLPSTVWKLIKRTKTKQVLLGSYISDDLSFHFKHNHDNPHQMWSKKQRFPEAFPFSYVGHWTLCAAILHSGKGGIFV